MNAEGLLANGFLVRFFDSCETMMAVVDRYSRVIHANKKMREVTHMDETGPDPACFTMLFGPEDGLKVEKALRNAFSPEEGECAAELDARLLPECGGEWVGIRVHHLPEDFAAVEMTIITAYKELSEKLAHVALEWTTTFDAMSDAVALINRDNTITRANFSMAALFGVHPRQLVGRKCYEVMHNSDRPWSGCPHMECMKTGNPVSAEICDPNLGLPLYVTCSPMRDGAGRLVGTIHVSRDITVQRKEQDEREELIAKLQQAMSEVKLLTGLLPICSNCKKIRDKKGSWHQMEAYITGHSQAHFSHGICPECARLLYPEFADKMLRQGGSGENGGNLGK